MADIKVSVSLAGLQKDLETLSEQMADDIRVAVGQLAKNVENEAMRLSAHKLHSSWDNFNDGLRREKLGEDSWVVYLEDDSMAAKLEEGYAAFDMKPGFFNSTKFGEKGYLDIPIDQHPFSAQPSTQKVTDMRSAVEAVLKDKSVERRIEKFNESSTGLTKFGDVERFSNISDERVSGLVKVTKPGKNNGTYMLFRRVSKNSSPDKWIHPGYEGIHIFEHELQDYAQKEMDNILRKIIG